MIRSFDIQHDALELVLEAIVINRPEIVDHCTLDVENEDGKSHLIPMDKRSRSWPVESFRRARRWIPDQAMIHDGRS